MFVLAIVMMTLYPVLIAPLFNKFTPVSRFLAFTFRNANFIHLHVHIEMYLFMSIQLPDGELRQKIENLAASLMFPLKKLFVVDGSTRSSHSNVKFYLSNNIFFFVFVFGSNTYIVLITGLYVWIFQEQTHCSL